MNQILRSPGPHIDFYLLVTILDKDYLKINIVV